MTYDPQPAAQKPRTPVWVLLTIILACGVVFLLFVALFLGALLLPAVQAAREAARRNLCANNFKQLALALHTYHDKYQSFPPAYTVDAAGTPMHSWRVLVLPFLDDPVANRVYSQYHFNEPWNGPNNSRVDVMPDVFRCPSNDGVGPMTSYVAVVGPEAAWPGDKSVGVHDFQDGLSNTVMLVESLDAGVHWMEPKDLPAANIVAGINASSVQPSASSNHFRGANAAFADGSVRLLNDAVTPQELQALATRSGSD